MKLKLIYTTIFVCVFGYTKAQESVAPIVPEDEYVLPFDSLKAKDLPDGKAGKMHVQFSTGVGMSFSNNFGSSTSMYYSPSVSYSVSPKLEVSGGMTYINSEVSNFRMLNDFGYRPFSGNISQYYTSIAARYQLNERLKIGGSVFYNMTEFNSTAFAQNKPISSFDRVGYSAFFEYKISENTYLQGEIRVNDSNRVGLFNNAFGSQGFFYQDSSFGSPFGR
jgi:hypothetical protein